MTFPPKTTHQKPLAIALGDPAGIGPEIILDSYRRLKDQSVPFFIMGGAQCLATAEEQAEIACPVVAINDPSEAADAFADGLPVLKALDAPYTPGAPSDEGAALALHSLAEATRCVIEGKAAALVTAPVSKAGLTRVGFEYPGQTEFLAQVCGMAPDDAVMMLAGPTLRTVPLTVHVALSAVPALISIELITHKARIVAAALKRDFGCDLPRIAIAGLNPHSGEGGQFGNEEGRFIEPAIATLRDEGIEAVGPVPGDALFTPRMRKTYDAALCMYHDQALIPIKAIEFDEGVNVTLGLPIVRTSPDHGTAFDIAGSGVADSSAMVAAIKMAAACASARAEGGVHG